VILLVCDEDELTRRLLDRSQLESRDDDSPETIAQRLRVYREQTEPLIEYYRRTGKLREVDGRGTPDEVFARITESLAA
jgi:adenylate kinase